MRLHHMNNITRRTLVLVLLSIAPTLFAASPEYQVGGTVSTAAPNTRAHVRVASDGTDFLVAWMDWRSPNQAAIVATRVTRDGRVLEPLGIRIPARADTVMQEVWDGANYVLYWTDHEAGTINVARIDREGRVVTPPRVLMDDATINIYGTTIVSNGTLTAMLYYPYDGSGKSHLALIDRDLNVVRDTAIDIPSPADVALSGNSTGFLVAWSSERGLNREHLLEAVKVSPDGAVGPVVSLGFSSVLAVATDGANFLIVSSVVDREFSRATIRVRAVAPDLTPLGPPHSFAEGYGVMYVHTLWRLNRYEVIFAQPTAPGQPVQSWTHEFGRDGELIETHVRDRAPAALATNGSEVLAAIGDLFLEIPTHQIFARLYRGESQTAERQEMLSWSGNGHTRPAIAASGANHLVAWSEEDSVYYTRVDAQGASLDGRGIRVGKYSTGARVAFDGAHYVLAWYEPHNVGVRFIDPATGATTAEARTPAEVWNGIDIAVTPDVAYIAISEERVRVVALQDGSRGPAPPGIYVSPENTLVDTPRLSWNGSELLVVWNEFYYPRGTPPIPAPFQTLGARVSSTLALLDHQPLVIAVAGEYSSLGAPSVASNGEDWLVAVDVDAEEIIARRVRSNGAVEGQAPATIAQGERPDVIWDGANYALGWKDGENVRIARIPAEGPLALTRQTLAATRTAPSPVAIAPAANDHVAVAYTRASFRPEHTGVERTFLRFMDFPTTPRGRVVRR